MKCALSAPGPTVVMMHGNLRSGSYHGELAATLASRGFVVVLPDMPCGLGGCDHDANAAQLTLLLAWASEQNTDPSSPLYGRSNGRRGLLGHSYGGLGAFLATARDPSVEMLVLLDPKDDLGAAAQARQSVQVPSAHLMAEVRGVCNDDWATLVYPETGAPRLRLRVSGAGHCDVEQPTDGLCPLACGRGAGGAEHFRRYAVAFAACVLQGDSAMEPYVGGALMAEDNARGVIDLVDHAALEELPCRSAIGAPPPFDAGAATSDAGPSNDLGPLAPDAGDDGAAGDGCRCLGAGAGRNAWGLGVLLPLVLGLSARSGRESSRRALGRRASAARSRCG